MFDSGLGHQTPGLIRAMHFVFLHVGEDPRPGLLVRSIHRVMPDARITQCSDAGTPAVAGVSQVFRHEADPGNLMRFRLHCYADLALESPAAYLDTDMLVLQRLDPGEMLGAHDAVLCERTFGRGHRINTRFKGMDLSEYAGKTFGEVYPYLGCFTITRSSAFWRECLDCLRDLDPKFHFWYGDQEALRNVARSGRFRIAVLPESEVGCLPEFAQPGTQPRVLHFKGARRKDLMLQTAARILPPS